MEAIGIIVLLIIIATLGTNGLACIILAGLALCFVVGIIQGMIGRARNKPVRKEPEIIVESDVKIDNDDLSGSCNKANRRYTTSSSVPNCTSSLYQNTADKEAKRKQYASLVRVAGMSGNQFEKFCAELLEYNGFHDVQLVCSKMYAEGVDITAKRDQARYAFQCIRTNKREIGKKEIMEVHKSKTYYGCDYSVIITNSFFTKEAIELANTTHTILWDDRDLQRLMDKAAKVKYL